VEHKEPESGHGDIEPVVVRKLAANENLADEMKKHGIDCEALYSGSHPLERGEYYSYLFPLTSRLVTNRGVVKVRGRTVSFIQILQRN
jgi:hypothetical protein